MFFLLLRMQWRLAVIELFKGLHGIQIQTCAVGNQSTNCQTISTGYQYITRTWSSIAENEYVKFQVLHI